MEHQTHETLLYADEAYVIQGAVFAVYREMGAGFLETVYQECLEHELCLRKVPFVAQQPLALTYKSHRLEQIYKPDLICFGKIIVELKAVSELANEHIAQVLNYLKATELRLGLLVNFGHQPKAQIKRVIR